MIFCWRSQKTARKDLPKYGYSRDNLSIKDNDSDWIKQVLKSPHWCMERRKLFLTEHQPVNVHEAYNPPVSNHCSNDLCTEYQWILKLVRSSVMEKWHLHTLKLFSQNILVNHKHKTSYICLCQIENAELFKWSKLLHLVNVRSSATEIFLQTCTVRPGRQFPDG